MTLKSALAIALVAAATVPAAAGAQATINPPDGDNYLGPIALSDFAHPAPFPKQELGFVADTTNYTLQSDLFNPPGSGGPPEPQNCGSPYGKTLWMVFHADRYGVMHVTTSSGFDSVIGLVPFKDPVNDARPNISQGVCIDAFPGAFTEDLFGFVKPNRWYAIQVGGVGPSGGPISVKLAYQPPFRVDGDAVLTWKNNPSGAKVVKLEVTAAKGVTVSVGCTKHGCKGPRPFTVKKAPVFKPFGVVGPLAQAQAPPSKTQVHAAKKFGLLKGQILKAGSKLIVRISAPGYIGKYFSWNITKSGAGAKTTSCTKPYATTPPKKGGCG
jgi:hypothetical protein